MKRSRAAERSGGNADSGAFLSKPDRGGAADAHDCPVSEAIQTVGQSGARTARSRFAGCARENCRSELPSQAVSDTTRIVHHGDGVAWLEAARLHADAAIVTSLPDASELPELGLERWRAWFVQTAALACTRVADDAVAIFYQTDIKHEGRWIDKAYLVQRGAELAGT